MTSTLDGQWSASRSGHFNPKGKNSWHPLDRRLVGLQSRSGHDDEEKNSQPLPGLEPPTIQPVAPSTILLRYPSSWNNLVANYNVTIITDILASDKHVLMWQETYITTRRHNQKTTTQIFIGVETWNLVTVTSCRLSTKKNTWGVVSASLRKTSINLNNFHSHQSFHFYAIKALSLYSAQESRR
jgi:hypothetical protein